METSKFELIGQAAPGGVSAMKCQSVTTPEGEKYYLFSYKDYSISWQLNEWKDFKVNNEDDFESLYQRIIEGFDNPPEDAIMLDLSSGDIIWLAYKKAMGSYFIQISSGKLNSNIIGFSNQFNRKQINKLFGKEEESKKK